jgi:tetratricopeptide (TPR) repeat protein
MAHTLRLVALFYLICWFGSSCLAQQRNQYPADPYYGLLDKKSSIYSGDLKAAKDVVGGLYRGATRINNRRWLDSIFYLHLDGEIAYLEGDFSRSLQKFDEALEIYGSYINWPMHVSWDAQPPQNDVNALRVAKINWGEPTRPFVIGRFPKLYFYRLAQPLQNAGRNREKVTNFDAIELFRVMALILRRKNQILGVCSQVDPVAGEFRTQLMKNAPPQFPRVFHSILLGIALSGVGEWDQSDALLDANAKINGLDHPLTPVALLQMASNRYDQGDYVIAKSLFFEASYSAVFFGQWDLVRESLMMAGRAQMAGKERGPLLELDLAIEWARANRLQVCETQLSLIVAENAIENGNLPDAIRMLALARKRLPGDMSRYGQLAMRLAVLDSTVSMLEGGIQPRVWHSVVAAYRPITEWGYQIDWIFKISQAYKIDRFNLERWAKVVLRDPTEADWSRDPFETLAYLSGDRSQLLDRALMSNLTGSDITGALLASEAIRRNRFQSQLVSGGRVQSLRNFVVQSKNEVPLELRETQREALERSGDLRQIIDEIQQTRGKITSMPIVPRESHRNEWAGEVKKLNTLYDLFDQRTTALAVRRVASPMSFPPSLNLDQVQEQMPRNSACLAIILYNYRYHFILVRKLSVSHIASLDQMAADKAIQDLAKSWGHRHSSAAIVGELFADDSWKNLSRQLFAAIFPADKTLRLWENLEDLVIIPAGAFWYLPFEALVVSEEQPSKYLIDRVPIRYIPYLNLAFEAPRTVRPERLAAYVGQIDQRDDAQLAANMQTGIRQSWPTAELMDGEQWPIQQMAPLVDALVYLQEIRQPLWPGPWEGTKYKRESHLSLDLEQWRQDQGPDILIVAGGNTAIADGFRGSPTGLELEYYSTLLLTAGCQSVVLPRWRCGGNVPYDIHLALIRRMSGMPMASALQQSIIEARSGQLDPVQPRLRTTPKESELSADHPFGGPAKWLSVDPRVRKVLIRSPKFSRFYWG